MFGVLLFVICTPAILARSLTQAPDDTLDVMLTTVDKNLPDQWQFHLHDPIQVSFLGFTVFSLAVVNELTASKPYKLQRNSKVYVEEIKPNVIHYTSCLDLEQVDISENFFQLQIAFYKFSINMGMKLVDARSNIDIEVDKGTPGTCKLAISTNVVSKIHFFTSNHVIMRPITKFLEIIDGIPIFHDLFDNIFIPDISGKLSQSIEPVAQNMLCH
uniref:Uncharacterized protein n=1 Tax=Riptortus pedestris TaxID=329032 RepID=R4WKI1_RIPPE|nr:unknown secreted protein [Riptortus pedestris]